MFTLCCCVLPHEHLNAVCQLQEAELTSLLTIPSTHDLTEKKIYVLNPVATPPSVRLGMIKMQRGNMLSCVETTTLVTLSAHEMPGPPLLGIRSMNSSQRKRGRQTDIQRHTHIHLKQNCGFHIIRIAELFCCWSCFKLAEFSSCSTA